MTNSDAGKQNCRLPIGRWTPGAVIVWKAPFAWRSSKIFVSYQCSGDRLGVLPSRFAYNSLCVCVSPFLLSFALVWSKMSFPRAKLQRFNEIKSKLKKVRFFRGFCWLLPCFLGCTPSPADYNVANGISANGAINANGEKFAEPKSFSSAADTGSSSSTLNSTFRTVSVF